MPRVNMQVMSCPYQMPNSADEECQVFRLAGVLSVQSDQQEASIEIDVFCLSVKYLSQTMKTCSRTLLQRLDSILISLLCMKRW